MGLGLTQSFRVSDHRTSAASCMGLPGGPRKGTQSCKEPGKDRASGHVQEGDKDRAGAELASSVLSKESTVGEHTGSTG